MGIFPIILRFAGFRMCTPAVVAFSITFLQVITRPFFLFRFCLVFVFIKRRIAFFRCSFCCFWNLLGYFGYLFGDLRKDFRKYLGKDFRQNFGQNDDHHPRCNDRDGIENW